MTESFTFSYIVVEQRRTDLQGNPVVGVYPFWSKNPKQGPIRILESDIPSITANIYAGNPYPELDYTNAIERRIKRDIQENVEYSPLVADQIQDKGWHLQDITPVSTPKHQRG